MDDIDVTGLIYITQMHPFFHKVFASNLASTMYYYMPVLYEVLSRIPVPALTDFFNAWRALLDIASIAYKNSLSNASKKNIFSEILAKAENDPEGRLTPMQVTVEAGGLIIAGSDTTSESLTYLIWAALKRPEVQQALQDELLAYDLELRDAELEKLPVLNAVIKETLRLYSAVPMPQPRVVPKGGVTLEGQFLPEGTVVNTTPYVSHRDPAVFPNPEKYGSFSLAPPIPIHICHELYIADTFLFLIHSESASTTPAGYPMAQRPYPPTLEPHGGLLARAATRVSDNISP